MHRVLIIGENTGVSALAFRLGSIGFQTVTSASEASAALRAAFSWKPNAIVLDTTPADGCRDLFNLLEKVQPYEVKMVSVRPVFGAGPSSQPGAPDLTGEEIVPVNVEGMARDLTAFLDFERALMADPHFDRVAPERRTHTENGEVLFLLSFLYDPEGRVRHEPTVEGSADAEGGDEDAEQGEVSAAAPDQDAGQGEGEEN